ncbi:MAG: protein arginine kinase [Pirellulales bacterium]|nr:protein arginine kinase [Pirellulales bacterium]
MELNDLTKCTGEWLRGVGPEADIVISSRIRLARNLAEYAFINRATPQDRQRIVDLLREKFGQSQTGRDLINLDIEPLEKIDRQLLVERHLISRELAEMQGPRAVIIDAEEKFSVMINEEDHLRIQAMQSGLSLLAVWEQINRIDDQIEEKIPYAFHEKLGYLTACPTNVGTGLRVSVMLHLPALVITRQIEKVFRSLQKINLAVRGLYGEGSQAQGDFYQISNQITLGRSEMDLIKQVGDIVPVIIDYERQAREFLMKESHENLHDRVSRAYGILRTAQTINSEETMHLLSSVRMGVNLELIRDVGVPKINLLFLHTQPAHLQKLIGGEMDSSDRNIERARYLRRHLSKEKENGPGAEAN